MKKTINICDECKKTEATITCKWCGKDLCRFCYEKLEMGVYPEEDDGYNTLKLSFYKSIHRNPNIILCKGCADSVKKLFRILREGDGDYIIESLLKEIKRIAEVEAI